MTCKSSNMPIQEKDMITYGKIFEKSIIFNIEKRYRYPSRAKVKFKMRKSTIFTRSHM